MEKASDEILIERAVAGNMAAFKELVVRHEGKVAGVVHSMLGPTPEAEDIGQEVFIRFYDSLKKFRGDSSLSTYLIRIAINLSINELNRRKRSTSRYSSIEKVGGGSEIEERMDLNEHLEYAFNQLSSEFKSVATLRLIEGYSTEETSELLGIPLGTVLSRLARAQQRLRSSLTKKLK